MGLSKEERRRRNAARSRVKLSKAGKMPCLSWSLQAGETCPGSRLPNGEAVPACEACYAMGANYRWPNVRAVRVFNRTDWQRADWVDDMRDALLGETHFRWFDSGDIYHPDLAHRIADVIELTRWVRHWIPSRTINAAHGARWLRALARLDQPNSKVRWSSPDVDGSFIRGVHGSAIIPHAGWAVDSDVTVCRAYEREGKCGDCRACWDKSVPVIAYPIHGNRAAKALRNAGVHLSEVADK